MILIGSRALILRNHSLLNRSPQDFDFIGTREEVQNWMNANKSSINPIKIYDLPEVNKTIWETETDILEFEYAENNNSASLFLELVKTDPSSVQTKFGLIPNLDLLFTLKSSHKYKKFNTDPRSFWKTAVDYHAMKQAGAFIRSEYNEFYQLREKESYKFKTPSLKKDASSFFNIEEVDYKYNHDSIHAAVALQEKPAYTYFAKDGEEVLSDQKKFFECSEEIRLNAVIEEASVLAIERSLSYYEGAMTEQQAYAFALAKLCTSISSGFFRHYAFENVFKVLDLYPKDYYLKFKKALADGKIIEYKK